MNTGTRRDKQPRQRYFIPSLGKRHINHHVDFDILSGKQLMIAVLFFTKGSKVETNGAASASLLKVEKVIITSAQNLKLTAAVITSVIVRFVITLLQILVIFWRGVEIKYS